MCKRLHVRKSLTPRNGLIRKRFKIFNKCYKKFGSKEEVNCAERDQGSLQEQMRYILKNK